MGGLMLLLLFLARLDGVWGDEFNDEIQHVVRTFLPFLRAARKFSDVTSLLLNPFFWTQ
jgi:hypothetical protein